MSFQHIEKHLSTKGTVPVPPNRSFALRLYRITYSGIVAPVGVLAAGAEVLHAVAPKSVKKNILRISYEKITQLQYSWEVPIPLMR